jgi:hypothetical protein
MQTFLPHRDFGACARVLDRQRLGKQRVENMQILCALYQVRVFAEGKGLQLEARPAGWSNHLITKMWAGYEPMLLRYQKAICDEWTSRGYKDTCWGKTAFIARRVGISYRSKVNPPPFLGNFEFHRAYRRILIAKAPEHYLQAFQITTQYEVRSIMQANLDVIYRYGVKDPEQWHNFIQQRRLLAEEIAK